MISIEDLKFLITCIYLCMCTHVHVCACMCVRARTPIHACVCYDLHAVGKKTT